MDVRLNTSDAFNSVEVLFDIIRGFKLAKLRGLGGSITPLCMYGFKSSPSKHSLVETYKLFKDFIKV